MAEEEEHGETTQTGRPLRITGPNDPFVLVFQPRPTLKPGLYKAQLGLKFDQPEYVFDPSKGRVTIDYLAPKLEVDHPNEQVYLQRGVPRIMELKVKLSDPSGQGNAERDVRFVLEPKTLKPGEPRILVQPIDDPKHVTTTPSLLRVKLTAEPAFPR